MAWFSALKRFCTASLAGMATALVSYGVLSSFLADHDSMLRFITFAPCILAGIVSGWVVQKRGWLIGAMMGFLLPVIAFILIASALMHYTIEEHLNIPISIVVTAVSGAIGEYVYKKYITSQVKKKGQLIMALLILKIGLICGSLFFLLVPLRLVFMAFTDIYNIGFVHITGISHTEESNRTSITLRGWLFTRDRNTILFTWYGESGQGITAYGQEFSSPDGRTLTFPFSQDLGTCRPYEPICAGMGLSLPSRYVEISVLNSFGESNRVTLP